MFGNMGGDHVPVIVHDMDATEQRLLCLDF